MRIELFKLNNLIFYTTIGSNDIVELELTNIGTQIPKTVVPVISQITNQYFIAQIYSVQYAQQEDLQDGKIFLDLTGLYNYRLFVNNIVAETGQFNVYGTSTSTTTQVNGTLNTTIYSELGQPGTSGTSGVSGTSGANGQSFNILGTLPSPSDLPPTANQGDAYIINNELWVYNGSQWNNIGQFNGTSGVSGSSGTSGTSGLSGTSGVNGISAGRVYYFNQSQNSDIATYKVLAEEPTSGAIQTVTKSIDGNSSALIEQYITPQLGFNVIPSGVQRFYLYFTKPASNDNMAGYITLQLASSTGTPIGPLITSQVQSIDWNAGNPSETIVEVVFTTTNIDPTNRMIVKIYGQNNNSSTKNLVYSTENGEYSFVVTSIGVNAATSGTSGSSGTSGANGSNGTSGLNGTSGVSGTAGTSGLTGTSGTSSNGSSGTSGTSGANGSSGTSGLNGSSGTSGSRGTSGTSGITGSAGTSGTSAFGTSGTSGLTGTSGTSSNGSSGTSGANGVAGSSGTSGMGSPGTSGTSGIGTNGTSGISGISGTSGTSGANGVSGTSGTSSNGSSGTSGANGVAGSSGTSGLTGTSGTSSNGSSGTSGISGTSGTSSSGGGGDLTVLAQSTTDTGPVNTTTETPLFNFTLPTDLAAGETLVLEIAGISFNNSGNNNVFTVKTKIGTTDVITVANTQGSAAFSRHWVVRIVINIEDTDAQRVSYHGQTWPQNSGNFNAYAGYGGGFGTASEDTTSAKTFQLTCTNSVANANIYMYAKMATLYRLSAP